MNVPDAPDRLTAGEVAALTGKAAKSVRRWMRAGVAVGGRRVRLASVKVGGSRVTCGAWLAAFLDALNPGGAGAPPVPTPAERRRRGERARAELARLIGR